LASEGTKEWKNKKPKFVNKFRLFRLRSQNKKTTSFTVTSIIFYMIKIDAHTVPKTIYLSN